MDKRWQQRSRGREGRLTFGRGAGLGETGSSPPPHRLQPQASRRATGGIEVDDGAADDLLVERTAQPLVGTEHDRAAVPG